MFINFDLEWLYYTAQPQISQPQEASPDWDKGTPQHPNYNHTRIHNI